MINLDEKKLLEIEDLSVSFTNGSYCTKATRNVSLGLRKGEILGLAGESGSGKSVTARTVAGLIRHSKATPVNGTIRFNGLDLLKLRAGGRLLGQKISMIFQDPHDSLNPSFTVGRQIEEVFLVRKRMNRKRAREKVIQILEQVEIPSPRSVARRYPHQLSGGMCQRVMIAIALSSEPDLLIADEPTTALDVTIQARILGLLGDLNRKTQTSMLFITHDLGVIAQFCHSVAIMLEGEIVEKGSIKAVFANPLHPYTRGLIGSIPVMGRKKRLTPMAAMPEVTGHDVACHYYPRCAHKSDRCRLDPSKFSEYEAGHFVRCTGITGGEYDG